MLHYLHLTTVPPIALLTSTADMADVMNNGMTMSERLAYAGQMTAVGMLVVFAVLALIYVVMLGFRAIFYELPKRRAGNLPKAETTSAEAAQPDEPVATAQKDADMGEIVAVLTAAVAAVLADEAAASGTDVHAFRVVSFRRTAGGCAWNRKF